MYLGLGHLPCPHFPSSLIEDPLVVPLADFLARRRVQKFPKRLILVIDLKVLLLVGRRHLIGAEQETVRVAIDAGQQ